jgi:hypothetical protein
MFTRFRLALDVPYEFAVEPGYYRSAHCRDMRPKEGDLNNTVQDPLTGLITLAPSHLTPVYANAENWVPLPEWQNQPAFWSEAYRGADPDRIGDAAKFFSSIDPGTSYGLLPTLSAVTYGLINKASALTSDILVWAMQTIDPLGADEGFVWNYHALSDEHHRPENWFCLAWGGLFLHFSTSGTCRAYLYPRTGSTIDYTATPEFLDSFNFGVAGDILNKEGAFSFQPIPRFGLVIYHVNSAQSLSTQQSSGASQATNGFLLRVPLYEDNNVTGTGDVMLPSSSLAFGICANLLRAQHVFGMHKIRYPVAGTFTDALYDPGFNPTILPDTAPSPIYTKAFVSGITAITTITKKADLSGDWAPGEDRQGRVLATLTTGDPRYTPYILATNVTFSPIFETRNTTPVPLGYHGTEESENLPDQVWQLEFTDDENGRFEGSATVMVKTDEARQILERGDMTFALEKSFDDGETWENHSGGLARVEGDVSAFLDDAGMFYVAKLSFADMFARYREVAVLWEGALDGLSIPDAINKVQLACSLSPLASIPLELALAKLPDIPAGQHWKFGPRISDHGDEVIRNLLLLTRRQYEEWILKHSWTDDEWTLTQKPRDLTSGNLWTLTPFRDEVDIDNRYALLGDGSTTAFTFAPIPPEANRIAPFGLTDTNPSEADRVPCPPLVNYPSILSADSPDFLGRIVSAAPLFASLTDVPQIMRMGRRVYDAIAHRRLKAPLRTRVFIDDLGPLARVNVRGMKRISAGSNVRANVLTEQWVKMRTVQIDYQGAGELAPNVTYHTDSTWEGEIK